MFPFSIILESNGRQCFAEVLIFCKRPFQQLFSKYDIDNINKDGLCQKQEHEQDNEHVKNMIFIGKDIYLKPVGCENEISN